MFKKFIVGLLLVMGVVCFADYKSDFNWNFNDAAKIAKIEKGLAEATAAKDTGYIRIYTKLKTILGKDTSNTSYAELKQLLKNTNQNITKRDITQIVLMVKRFNPFIKNILADPEFNNYVYVNTYYIDSDSVFQIIGFKAWREKFINIDKLSNINKIKKAQKIFKLYKKASVNLSNAEIKTDCAIFKRAWYTNIAISDDWKKLLVQIELMIKSVE